MKRWIFAATIASLSLSAEANDILLEACNNIPDPTKRLECLKAIPKSAPAAPASEVERAFNDLQAILNSGTSYNSYSTQIETAVKAANHFGRFANTPQQISAAKLFSESLEAHKDAQAFWQADIRWYAKRDNYITWPRGLPVELTGTSYLVTKYNLQTTKSDFWGLNRGLPKLETLTAIWAVANQRSDEANESSEIEKLRPTSTEAMKDIGATPANQEEAVAVQRAGTASGCVSIHTPTKTNTSNGVSIFRLPCVDGSSIQVVCSEDTCQVGAR